MSHKTLKITTRGWHSFRQRVTFQIWVQYLHRIGLVYMNSAGIEIRMYKNLWSSNASFHAIFEAGGVSVLRPDLTAKPLVTSPKTRWIPRGLHSLSPHYLQIRGSNTIRKISRGQIWPKQKSLFVRKSHRKSIGLLTYSYFEPSFF